MNWHELADNPRAISTLYTTVPPLESVQIVDLKLEQNPFILLKLDNIPFPDHLPARWILRGYTSILLELHFFFIKSFQLSQESEPGLVDIIIEKMPENNIQLHTTPSSAFYLELIADDFSITIYKR